MTKQAIVNILSFLPPSDREAINSERVSNALASLPPRDRLLLRMRFGLDGAEPMTQAEIAKALGMTQQAVSWRLRRYSRMLHN